MSSLGRKRPLHQELNSDTSTMSTIEDNDKVAHVNLVQRYSRQMLLPQVGPSGQLTLKNSSVLVIGTGGLGSAVIMYLAGAGLGRIDLIDFDVVDESNLHRQIIHSERNVGRSKVQSAYDRICEINSSISCNILHTKLTFENAKDILDKNYSTIIDCTDNQLSRYILNDCCYLLNIPLIHGSAIGMEGQLTLFSPRHVEGCRSCSGSGVLGPIPGLIGCLQAIETIKLLLDLERSRSASIKTYGAVTLSACIGKQIYYDGITGEFETYTLPARNPDCRLCGGRPTIHSMADSEADYLTAMASVSRSTSTTSAGKLGANEDSVTVSEYADVVRAGNIHVLLDVRPEIQFDMVSLESTVTSFEPSNRVLNLPLKTLLSMTVMEIQAAIAPGSIRTLKARDDGDKPEPTPSSGLGVVGDSNASLQDAPARGGLEGTAVVQGGSDGPPLAPPHGLPLALYVMCRRGNDSQVATRHLRSLGLDPSSAVACAWNVIGGISAWSKEVDNSLPSY